MRMTGTTLNSREQGRRAGEVERASTPVMIRAGLWTTGHD